MKKEETTADLLQGKLILKQTIDVIFNDLENQLLDKREITVDFLKVTLISVYFLERLERFIEKGKSLGTEIKVINVSPDVYKVFQVARLKTVLSVCLSG